MMPRKRLAWGSLWSDAPWDGKPKTPTPIAIPATLAARVPVSVPEIIAGGKRVLRRLPFGKLLAGVPWSGKPAATVSPTSAHDPMSGDDR